MNKSLRRRVAAVATTATVGGLLLPFLAAGSSLAAVGTPTGLTANPSNGAANVSSNAVFKVTELTNIGPFHVYVQGATGPDASVAPQMCAQIGATNVSNCTFPTGPTPGTDSVLFFYSVNNSGIYAPGDPSTTANLSVAGPISRIVLTPASPSPVAASDYKTYSVTATDAGGRPVVGAALSVTATEANTDQGDLDLQTVKPVSAFYPGSRSTTAASVTPATLTIPPVVVPPAPAVPGPVTADGTMAGTLPGVANFYVASRNPGTISLAVSVISTPGILANGAVTVNPGTANDIATVTVNPTAQRAFTSDTVTTVVNVRNGQGDPVAGITPSFTLSGTNSAATVTGGTTDTSGNVTATYPAGATRGSDTLTAFVNQSTGASRTLGLDPGEPSAVESVTLVPTDVTSLQLTSPNGSNVNLPLTAKTTTLTYVVAGSGSTNAGYNVLFTAPAGTGKFTLSTPSAVTDASGKVSVTVTNANPSDADSADVIATIGTKTAPPAAVAAPFDKVTVTYQASAVSNQTIKITPFANTTQALGTTSFTASAADQFGAAVTGLSFDWTVSGRNTATSTPSANNTTFSYTDTGTPTSATTDVVTVTVRSGVRVLGTDTANQYWVTTPATATQANIDLGDTAGNYNGDYTTSGPASPTNPVVASGFTKTKTVAVNADPVAGVAVAAQKVLVKLTDAANNRLYGKTVSLTSSGVGVFTDSKGNPVGTSATATVADANAAVQYAGTTADSATVYVRSTQGGTQNITATVDGITTTATVTYSGQFVGVAPIRVLDTRTGQGGLYSGTNTPTPAGPLAPNTSYTLDYGVAGLPLGSPAYGAYVFNITAIKPSGLGNLRVAPGGGQTAPTTSLINYQSGSDVANFVVVPNNGTDSLQLFSAAASANVAVDLVGYYPTASGVNPTTPSRIADTRNGAGPLVAGETRSFQVAGQGGLPGTTAKAVALNVTVVNPSGLGNLRIFADGDALPTTSNINYIPGQDKSAFVIVNLPANGKISVYSAGSTVDVAIDAYASYDKVTSNIVTQTPVRILDTRPSNTLQASKPFDLQVTGVAGVPANAQAVLVSVTGIHTTGSTGSGNLRVYPSGGTMPIVSTLNYVSSTSDVANFAIVPIGANGKISINSEGSPIDVAVDVLGYVPAG